LGEEKKPSTKKESSNSLRERLVNLPINPKATLQGGLEEVGETE
jgi:hypothetical protein